MVGVCLQCFNFLTNEHNEHATYLYITPWDWSLWTTSLHLRFRTSPASTQKFGRRKLVVRLGGLGAEIFHAPHGDWSETGYPQVHCLPISYLSRLSHFAGKNSQITKMSECTPIKTYEWYFSLDVCDFLCISGHLLFRGWSPWSPHLFLTAHRHRWVTRRAEPSTKQDAVIPWPWNTNCQLLITTYVNY